MPTYDIHTCEIIYILYSIYAIPFVLTEDQ